MQSEVDMQSSEKLITTRQLRERVGGVSEMTIWRWVQRGLLPKPRKINSRNYWPESVIDGLLDKPATNDARVQDAAA
jgi:predicted DNA-binding transcriptional regulator AlpA